MIYYGHSSFTKTMNGSSNTRVLQIEAGRINTRPAALHWLLPGVHDLYAFAGNQTIAEVDCQLGLYKQMSQHLVQRSEGNRPY